MAKIQITNINIGDDVYFENPHLNNHDLYWKVISKVDSHTLEIEIDEMGVKERICININDVRRVEKR